MAHLSPAAIFSPSVARQQLAAAKDWNYIDGWLTSKFKGKPAPPFERNNDTLKALLTLAALNEAADEDRDLLFKVETRSLQEFQAHETSNTDGIIQSLENHLTREGQASLATLATMNVVLNRSFSNTEQLARNIMHLQLTLFNIDQAAYRITVLEKSLKKELQHIKTLLEDLQSDTYRPPSDVLRQTLEYQRKAKVLAAKIAELKDRVASSSASVGTLGTTIQDVQLEEDKFKELMGVVKDLEAQVKVYHGLPHDTDLARLELEALRVELKEITGKRDGMFEGLVERESPQKQRTE